jgi:DNA polymerase-3 subunit chi
VPRVDFYILSQPAPNARALLACRLAEKAYKLGHTVYIHTTSAEQGQQLDDLLWTFRQGSFVPHGLYPPAVDDHSPVLIGWMAEPDIQADVLVNMTHDAPDFFGRFARVVELVDQDPDTLAKSRIRFRFYREQGCEPESHRL